MEAHDSSSSDDSSENKGRNGNRKMFKALQSYHRIEKIATSNQSKHCDLHCLDPSLSCLDSSDEEDEKSKNNKLNNTK